MFLNQYFATKSSYQRRQKRLLAKMNQPVTVTDIVVTQSKEYLAKKNDKWHWDIPNASAEGYVQRVESLLKMLAGIARQYYQATHIDEHGQLKDANKNSIVRLILNEFTLTPTDRPLSLEEFSAVLAMVEKMASQYQQNLTWVLSSLPVQLPEGHVHHYVVHVQCGKQPVIDTVAKVNACYTDPYYSKDNTSKKYKRRNQGSLAAAPRIAADTVVNFGGVVECETAGGAKYTTAVDICLDHKLREAKKFYAARLQQSIKIHQEFLPAQASHIITARSHPIVPPHLITPSFIHADPLANSTLTHDYSKKHGKFNYTKSRAIPTVIRTMLAHAEQFPELTHGGMSFSLKEGRVGVVNPAFGGNLNVEFRNPVQLAHVTGDLQKMIQAHNEHVLTTGFKNHCVRSQSPTLAMHALFSAQVDGHLDALCKTLDRKRSFWRRLLGIADCYTQQIDLVRYYQNKLHQSLSHDAYAVQTAGVIIDNFLAKAKQMQNSYALTGGINLLKQQFTAGVTAAFDHISLKQ